MRWHDRRGVTLAELLVVVVVIVVGVGIVAPAGIAARDRLRVERWVLQAATTCLRARTAALTWQRRAVVRFDPQGWSIRLVAGSDTLPHWEGPAAEQDGVQVAGPDRAIVFAPTGLAMGVSNGTWRFRRGAVERRLVVSRLGRVRVVPGAPQSP